MSIHTFLLISLNYVILKRIFFFYQILSECSARTVTDLSTTVFFFLFIFSRPQKNGCLTAIRFPKQQAFSSDKIFKFLLTLSEKPSIKHPHLAFICFFSHLVAVGERNHSFGESEKWDLQQVGSGFEGGGTLSEMSF